MRRRSSITFASSISGRMRTRLQPVVRDVRARVVRLAGEH
jgi:hypothetical protein